MNGHDPKIKSLQADAVKLIREFPMLLYRLHALPGDERVKQIEEELKEGLAHLNDLLGEVCETITKIHRTAGKITELENEK
jgi:hypothetical protein